MWEITGAEFSKAELHTAAGISIRFPRVTKFRDDKDWKSATNLKQLKDLFKTSKEPSDMTSENYHVTPTKITQLKREKSSDDSSASPSPKKKRVGVKQNVDDYEDNIVVQKKLSVPQESKRESKYERSYDKRHIETEHGFILDILSYEEYAAQEPHVQGMVKFTCGDGDLGSIMENDGTYEMVVKNRQLDDTTYSTLQKGFLHLISHLSRVEGKKVVPIIIDTKQDNSMLKGLSLNAIRTLMKNVFYSCSHFRVILICPGLQPLTIKKLSGNSGHVHVSNNGSSVVEFPFLKVYERGNLTETDKKMR